MDIHDFIKNHRRGFDKVKGKEDDFEYYEFEKKFINHINDNKFSITKKSRQIHITTLLANYVAWHMLFGKKQIVITVMNSNTAISHNFNEKVYKAIRDYNINIIPEHKTKLEIILGNGSRLKCVTSKPDALCSWNSDIIIIEGCAFIDNLSEILAVSIPTLTASSGRMILVSETNGLNKFFEIWEQSITGRNEFKNLSLNYKDNPRFNNDIWFNTMCRSLNMDKRQIQSELLAEFATWRPKPNKSVKLQIRASEEMLYDMQLMMAKYNISDYSKYIRKLIEEDINSLKHE